MRRALFGLALIPLMACSSVAGEAQAPNSVSGGSQELQTNAKHRSSKRLLHGAEYSKQTSRMQPDERSAPGSLPLSAAAAAYTSEHSPNLPISSVSKAAPPPTNSWTGFYVGVGAGVGVGTTQP
jgi:hypothetical protein